MPDEQTKDTTTYGRDVADKVRKLVESSAAVAWVKGNCTTPGLLQDSEKIQDIAERALADAIDELVSDVMPET